MWPKYPVNSWKPTNTGQQSVLPFLTTSLGGMHPVSQETEVQRGLSDLYLTSRSYEGAGWFLISGLFGGKKNTIKMHPVGSSYLVAWGLCFIVNELILFLFELEKSVFSARLFCITHSNPANLSMASSLGENLCSLFGEGNSPKHRRWLRTPDASV